MVLVASLTLSGAHAHVYTFYCARVRGTRIKPSVESPKSGILVTEVITFDTIAHRVILGRS